MTTQANCHCGAVQITMATPPTDLLECNCSLCGRYGAKWAYYTESEITVVADDDALVSYRWGDKVIDFHHCKTCFCLTHYSGTEHAESDRVAVNGRLLTDRALMDALPRRYFDGRDTWKIVDSF